VSRQDGAVTAEAAMVLPVLVLFLLALVWLVGLGVAQVRVVDAAREAARAAARGEGAAAAVALARRVAPAASSAQVSQGGQRVHAVVSCAVRGPGGLLALLPPVRVRAEAVAVREPGS
jgi:TadE-like protein